MCSAHEKDVTIYPERLGVHRAGLQFHTSHHRPHSFTGRCSAAANFDMLTETLRQARECELSLEERKVKLEEACLDFKREKWHASQRKTYVEAVYEHDEEVDIKYHHDYLMRTNKQ